MSELRRRLSKSEGFTLIELLVVIVILGILLAIAVPSFLGYRDRAQRRAAQADLRSAIPSAETYYSDHGNYTTLNVANMKLVDPGLSSAVSVNNKTASTYCLQALVGDKQYSVSGPGAVWYSGSQNCTGSTLTFGG